MTLKEAYALLDKAPASNTEPSAVNPNLTQAVVVAIVRAAAPTMGKPRDCPCSLTDKVDPFIELRVYQVFRNQKKPKYTPT